MIKRLFIVILLLFVITISQPILAYADEGISIIENRAEVHFPSALVFTIKAASSDHITKIRLHYEVEKLNYAKVKSEAWPIFTPATQVETKWVWDMRKTGGLPPGSSVDYWWTVIDEDGNSVQTPPDRVVIADNRYDWRSLTEGEITIYWYEGDESFAEELMAAAQDVLTRLDDEAGAELENRVPGIRANCLEHCSTSPPRWRPHEQYERRKVYLQRCRLAVNAFHVQS